MVVSSVYFARSSAGAGVAVGSGVLVGMGVMVAVGINDAVGVTVGAGAKDEQAERINVKRRRAWMVLFCMGCILTKKQTSEFSKNLEVCFWQPLFPFASFPQERQQEK